jgi:hypothetical protein
MSAPASTSSCPARAVSPPPAARRRATRRPAARRRERRAHLDELRRTIHRCDVQRRHKVLPPAARADARGPLRAPSARLACRSLRGGARAPRQRPCRGRRGLLPRGAGPRPTPCPCSPQPAAAAMPPSAPQGTKLGQAAQRMRPAALTGHASPRGVGRAPCPWSPCWLRPRAGGVSTGEGVGTGVSDKALLRVGLALGGACLVVAACRR